MKELFVLVVSLFLFTCLMFTPSGSENFPGAELHDKGNYYHVELHYAGGKVSPRKMGEALGEEIKRDIPDYEKLVDTFLTDLIISQCEKEKISKETVYKRVAEIKKNLDKNYRDEIDGLASIFSKDTKISLGDGRLSADEFYLLNLLPDTLIAPQGAMIAVPGSQTSTGKVLLAKSLDWKPAYPQVSKLLALTDIYNGEKSISLIGLVGIITAFNGYNEKGLFGSVFSSDKSGGIPHETLSGYYSCAGDLRHALENFSSVKAASEYLEKRDRKYRLGVNIVLADQDNALVIENDPLKGTKSQRTVRTNITKKTKIDSDGLKEIAIEDLYTESSHVLIIFDPKDVILEASWRDRSNALAAIPSFVTHNEPDYNKLRKTKIAFFNYGRDPIILEYTDGSGTKTVILKPEEKIIITHPKFNSRRFSFRVGEYGHPPMDRVSATLMWADTGIDPTDKYYRPLAEAATQWIGFDTAGKDPFGDSKIYYLQYGDVKLPPIGKAKFSLTNVLNPHGLSYRWLYGMRPDGFVKIQTNRYKRGKLYAEQLPDDMNGIILVYSDRPEDYLPKYPFHEFRVLYPD